jgi:hypothetical protein
MKKLFGLVLNGFDYFWMAMSGSTNCNARGEIQNEFPSTSRIQRPSPQSATRGYIRVYDGDTYFMSTLINSVALGPGKDVLIDGSFIGMPH